MLSKLRLIFHFYKGLLKLNLSVSVCFGLMLFMGFGYYAFPLVFMTAGISLSLLYFEISKKYQYYFYYNCSVSKLNLILGSLILNTSIGALVIYLLSLW